MLQLTSCSKKDYWLCLCSLIRDNLKRAWNWLIAATFYCSDNCCSMTKPFPILQMLGCERLTTNIRRMVLANKCCALVWLSKSATILIVVANVSIDGFANDAQFISTSIACVHNFTSSESNEKRHFSRLIVQGYFQGSNRKEQQLTVETFTGSN